jgi:hypothetical protein
MSNREQLAEGTSLTETLVDTVKIELIYKLKLCIDEINTEVDKVTYENIRSYEKMNKVLANLRKLDPNWTIDGGFDKPGMWDLTDMLEGILKHRIIDIEIDDQDIENLDLESYNEFHKALIDMRRRDPSWSINGTRRNLDKPIKSRNIGLPTNSSESENENEHPDDRINADTTHAYR